MVFKSSKKKVLFEVIQKRGKIKNLLMLSVRTVYRVMDPRGKFGEHERYVRVA